MDEDDAILDGADMLIADDEFIPFEDDAEDEDEVKGVIFKDESEDADAEKDKDKDVISDSDKTSKPPLKRQRLEDIKFNAVKWVKAYKNS